MDTSNVSYNVRWYNTDMTNLDLTSILSGLTPNTKRVYNARLKAFTAWLGYLPLDRDMVKRYMREWDAAKPQTWNGVLAAIKYLAGDLAAAGKLDHQTAIGIKTIRYKRVTGQRSGRWLTTEQLIALIALCRTNAAASTKGSRDAALIALLLGCGLRRDEACSIYTEQVRTVDGRMQIVNVRGKGGRLRTITAPDWAAQLITGWMAQLPTK